MEQGLLLAFNVVLGIAAFFGGMVIRGQAESIKDLTSELKAMNDKFQNYTPREEFRELRTEHRLQMEDLKRSQTAGFEKVFEKLDGMRDEISRKVDRGDPHHHRSMG